MLKEMETTNILCWICFIGVLILLAITVVYFLSNEKFKRTKLRRKMDEAIAQNLLNKVGQNKYSGRLYEEPNKRRISIGQQYND